MRVDPVFHGDERKIRAVRARSFGVDRQRAGRAKTRAEVVDADDKEPIRINRFARPDHVVPPADVLRLAGVNTGNVMRGIERVADQNRVGFVRIQRAVGFKGEIVGAQGRAAGERERIGEMRGLCDRDHGENKKARSAWR